MPNGGVFGSNMAPHDYTINTEPKPGAVDAVFGGIKSGQEMSDALFKAQSEKLKQEQQAAMQQELAEVAANPTSQGLLRLAIKYPSLAKEFQISQGQLSAQQQQANLNKMLPVFAALNSGNVDAAAKEMQTQADAARNSGNQREADAADSMIKVMKMDPKGFQATAGILLASALGPDKFAENFIKVQKAPEDLAHVKAQTKELEAKAAKEGQPKPETWSGFHPAVGPEGPGIYQYSSEGGIRKVPGLKPVKTPGEGGQVANPSGVSRQDAIDQAAQAIVQGRGKWPTGRELKDEILGPAIAKARAMDPSLNESTFKLRQNAQKEADTGKIGQSNNSIMTVMGHLGHLKDVFEKMPDSGMKGINWAAGKLKEIGPGGNPLLQEVQDLVEGIGPEMAKAYVPGQGTQGEREGWKDRINPFRPMEERKSNLKAFSSMLITKLNQNEAQYTKAFKGLSANAMPPPPQLTEDAYQALKSIQAWTGKTIPGAEKWLKRYEESGGETGTPTYQTPKSRSVTVDW